MAVPSLDTLIAEAPTSRGLAPAADGTTLEPDGSCSFPTTVDCSNAGENTCNPPAPVVVLCPPALKKPAPSASQQIFYPNPPPLELRDRRGVGALLRTEHARGDRDATDKLVLPHRKDPLRLPRNHPGLRILQHLRDEVHDHAVRYHRQVRSTERLTSVLDEIPGELVAS